MCNCKTEIEERLVSKFIENHPEAKNHKAELTGFAFIFGKTVALKACMPIELTADVRKSKKDDSLKQKIFKQNMIFSFCPFCGVKYE